MTKKVAYAAVFTAVITVLTMGSIPIPGGGYIHIGDSIIFLCCFIMPLPFAAIAAAVGSCFADLILGYTAYAVPTLIIKCIMAIIARLFISRTENIYIIMLGFLISSLFMQAGYLLFNTLVLGEQMSFIIFLINLVQTVASLPIAFLLVKAVSRVPDLDEVRKEWRQRAV